MDFTFVSETNNTVYIIDIMEHTIYNDFQLDVYTAFTSKNDLIKSYSHHGNRIKSGINISFYLRALKICSPQYLPAEEILGFGRKTSLIVFIFQSCIFILLISNASFNKLFEIKLSKSNKQRDY